MTNFIDEQFLRMIQEEEQQEQERVRENRLSIPEVTRAVLAGELELEKESIEFTVTEVVPGQVALRLPVSFSEMPEAYAKIKYPSERRPKLIYTNDTLTVNVTVNPTENRLFDDEMEVYQAELLKMLKRMQPNASWLSNGVFALGEVEPEAGQHSQGRPVQTEQQGKKRAGYYEFVSPAMDGNIYNLTFFMAWEEKGLFFGVNCMEKEMKLWRPIAHGMMASLQVIGQEHKGEG
ncbi:MAG: hypothetical protein E7L01_13880 [Paenibacillus macerans]|uniref:Uncharacterized protein n=1 Tax=Paenibacillus macerans TaxID=44252 RepID=A0A090ZP99_PAEMA|nr:hypothetical protein [Paenibacillus macerans]KFN12263.1 hypothetical protein DJ90_2050 [Paenibacillus macerans]MCY7558457.1 hypothetical protein [Paenibacillus macerans]MDU7474399.1 hypothetical protein [Paenibacillus macerans]MEC0150221.1 hypothetical protein [Paenibacillus macerans]MEC0331960.1 hypothetical protein [Paenibacillus macerans]